MFDLKRTGNINVHEFGSLFKYINDWKGLFERIDGDRSGYIEEPELRQGKPTSNSGLGLLKDNQGSGFLRDNHGIRFSEMKTIPKPIL